MTPQWSGHPPSELEFSVFNLGFIFMVKFMGPTSGPSWGNLSEQGEKKRSLNVTRDVSGLSRRQVASPEAQRKGKD